VLIRIFNIIIPSVLFFYSCGSETRLNIFGLYESKPVSKLDMLFKAYAIGMKLDIRKDYTFRYETCGNIASGTWKLKDDVLVLTPLEHKAKKYSSELDKKPIFYQDLKIGDLYRPLRDETNNVVVDQLEKISKK
jgi:hypothetical protein